MQFLREREVKIAVGAVTLLVSTVVFIFTTFATISYVDERHGSVIHLFEEQNKRLERIERSIDRNNDLLMDSLGRGRKR